jgi:hypothetical protein
MSDAFDPDELPDELLTPEQRRQREDPDPDAGPVDEPPETPDGVELEQTDETPTEQLDAKNHQEFLQREILKDIFRAKRDAGRKIAEAPVRADELGSGGTHAVNQAVHGAVWTLLQNVRSKLAKTDAGREYWVHRRLGRITLPLPDPPSAGHAATFELADADVAEVPDAMLHREGGGVVVDVVGLRDYATLPTKIEVEYEFEKRTGGRQRAAETQSKHSTLAVPLHVSRGAYEALNEFLSEIGLDVTTDTPGGVTLDPDELK